MAFTALIIAGLALFVALGAALSASQAFHRVRRIEARIRANEIAQLLGDVVIPGATAAGTTRGPEPAPEPGWESAVRDRARGGRVVEAVLLYRKATGAGLAEAVEAVKKFAQEG